MACCLALGAAALGQVPVPGVPKAVPKAAPPEVEASAVAAVKALGEDVTRGDFKKAVDRMNPRWLKRIAAQTQGGEEAVRKQAESASRLMAEKGVSILSSAPVGNGAEIASYEVGLGKRVVKGADGAEVEEATRTQWLVLVPTVTRYRMIVQGELKPVVIEKTCFQVAVADKGKNNWTFIDGSKLTAVSLRRIFLTLPADMALPPTTEREVK